MVPAITYRDLHESASHTSTALAYTFDLKSPFRIELGSPAVGARLSFLSQTEGDHGGGWWRGFCLALSTVRAWDRWIHGGCYKTSSIQTKENCERIERVERRKTQSRMEINKVFIQHSHFEVGSSP
jgi:hypothetical protein